MEREFNQQFNEALLCRDDEVEPPKWKLIDFVAKIAFAMHALESAVKGLSDGKNCSEIVINEEITLTTLLNAAAFTQHLNEVKELFANVSSLILSNCRNFRTVTYNILTIII